ncbi:MAG: glycosyltransferase family 2 protein [Kiritimatiellia bacterium]
MSEHQGALVSVILPLHNAAGTIADALESIRAQTYAPIEVLVVDDGSTDGGAALAESFPEVKVIYQEAQGVAAARNRGLSEAQGAYIAFLDQDDAWVPEKTLMQVELLEARGDAAYVVGWEHCELEEGCERPGWIPEKMLQEDHLGLHPGSMLVRRSAFDVYGNFDPQYRFASDLDWILRVRKLGGIQIELQETVIRKRIHHANESHHQKEMARERMMILARLRKPQPTPPS